MKSLKDEFERLCQNCVNAVVPMPELDLDGKRKPKECKYKLMPISRDGSQCPYYELKI